jgi:hypothetical protein
MACFDPTRSLLAGMDTTLLQARLLDMQQAYLDLSSGAKGLNYSYTQGDGAKAVTYDRTNLASLAQAIQLLQQQLGLVDRPRRPIRVVF